MVYVVRFQRPAIILKVFPYCYNTVGILKTFFKTSTVATLCCFILELSVGRNSVTGDDWSLVIMVFSPWVF
jgi:hypothetical protein